MEERRLLPEGERRRKQGHVRYGLGEIRGKVGLVGNDHVPLVGIDDIASTEFRRNLALDIAARLLDRGRICEAVCLSVLADAILVLPFGREAFGSGAVG